MHPDTGTPLICIYDGHPGGVGIWWTVPPAWAPEMARLGLDFAGGLHAAEHTVIGLLPLFACPCKDGCPACIQSPKCGNNNLTLDKYAARWLLQRLLASAPF